MDFIPPLEILLSPLELKICGFESHRRVEPYVFAFNLQIRLQTLYAQSFRITLAPPVLPRLLARS